jgi:hypothetical protein
MVSMGKHVPPATDEADNETAPEDIESLQKKLAHAQRKLKTQWVNSFVTIRPTTKTSGPKRLRKLND